MQNAFTDNPATHFTPLRFRLPTGLDANDPNLRIQLTYQENTTAGEIILWTVPKGLHSTNGNVVDEGGYRVQGNDNIYTLGQLNYDPMSGGITLFIQGVRENANLKTLAGVETHGRPDKFIEASLVTIHNNTTVARDKVKYLVTQTDSFFYHLQHDNLDLRYAMASRGVYGYYDNGDHIRDDLKNFGLKLLGEEELQDLGLLQDIVDLLKGTEHNVPGFNAAIYQDFLGGPDSFILTFAGMDDLYDVMDNIWQGIGLSSPQYNKAMEIAFELWALPQGISTLVITGHSLGGGLASAASVASGFEAVTFNAAGLSENTLYQRDLNGDLGAAEK